MDSVPYRQSALFRAMTEEEIADCVSALSAQTRHYGKGSVILHAGDSTSRLGIVLSGSVTIESNDIWGNRTVLNHVDSGGCFAETYALLPGSVLLVDVVANEDCRILSLDVGGLLQMPAESAWHRKFVGNLLLVTSHKNLSLSGRSFHTAPKTIRGRILSYLNAVSLQKHSAAFDIPFDRQQPADYLNVERTALSKELGKMRADGLIRCRKNHFTLL